MDKVHVCQNSKHAYRNGAILNVKLIIVTEEKKYTCRITRSQNICSARVLSLTTSNHKHLSSWFCSYELPAPFSCMLTTIYSIPPLSYSASPLCHYELPEWFVVPWSESDQQIVAVFFCVVVVVFLLLLLTIQSVFIRTADL